MLGVKEGQLLNQVKGQDKKPRMLLKFLQSEAVRERQGGRRKAVKHYMRIRKSTRPKTQSKICRVALHFLHQERKKNQMQPEPHRESTTPMAQCKTRHSGPESQRFSKRKLQRFCHFTRYIFTKTSTTHQKKSLLSIFAA